MDTRVSSHDALAYLFRYPDEQYHNRLADCIALLRDTNQDSLDRLKAFYRSIASQTPDQLQEMFTQIFDMNPVFCLELGWQLYGENYSRGEFLVEMRQTLQRLQIPESVELPDHLTHALKALGRMDIDEASRFTSRCLLPALDKILSGLRDRGCPFEDLLEAVHAIVTSTYGVQAEEVSCE